MLLLGLLLSPHSATAQDALFCDIPDLAVGVSSGSCGSRLMMGLGDAPTYANVSTECHVECLAGYYKEDPDETTRFRCIGQDTFSFQPTLSCTGPSARKLPLPCPIPTSLPSAPHVRSLPDRVVRGQTESRKFVHRVPGQHRHIRDGL